MASNISSTGFSTSEVLFEISNYKSKITQKVLSGETEEIHQIGSNAYTQTAWEKLLNRVDSNLEAVKEEQQERFEKMDKEAELRELYDKLYYKNAIQKNLDLKKIINEQLGIEGTFPYSYMSKDGVIEYNGVTFQCDGDNNCIMLGDCSDRKNCINIPLSEGGNLIVNRDNINSLSKAIDMFSPEDVARILKAISLDTKVQQMQEEIEEEKNSLGDSADARLDS